MREWKGMNLDAFKGEQRHAAEAINVMLHELSGAIKQIASGNLPDSSATSLTTVLPASSGGDGLGPDGDKGDVTVGGGGTTLTINNDAVVFAMMQEATQERLWGRGAGGGPGNVQEISLGTNLSMSGTTLNAATGAGTTTFSQQTVDFGDGAEQVITTIADAGILTTHEPMGTMAYRATGSRDTDELEMDQFEVKVGNIVDGVSYDIICTCLTGYGHGTYYVNVVY